MDSVLDLFLGDRVYDENGKLIKRDFGIKNILAIAVVVFVGYSLMGKSLSFPTLSGKKKGKKMKGGEVGEVGIVKGWGTFSSIVLLLLGFILGGVAFFYWAAGICFIVTIIIAVISTKRVSDYLEKRLHGPDR